MDYVLVIFGGVTGYSSDDINKFLWPVRIGSGVFPDDMHHEKVLGAIKYGMRDEMVCGALQHGTVFFAVRYSTECMGTFRSARCAD